jgi:polyribonucleotide nucleotidyltransferase
MDKIVKSVEIGKRILTLETGELAPQASAAVLARYGDTMVLSTVVAAAPKEDLGYFPLGIEYQERLYAGGRIKGSRWVKREGRPSDEAILTGRLIDRSIRPLFPKDYTNEVQVTITVLSVDSENDPSFLALVATSAALAISDIPWGGPIGSVRVGLKEQVPFVNPVDEELAFSELDLVVSATEERVVMLEAGAKEMPEEQLLSAIEFGREECSKIIQLIKDLVQAVGREKISLKREEPSAELVREVEKLAAERFEDLKAGEVEFGQIKEEMLSHFEEREKRVVAKIIAEIFKKKVRAMILENRRPDGRKLEEIRPLSMQVGILPRTHGSALFQRGQTQVLTVTTLGAPSLGQLIESATGEETKRYIHHYAMPPFSSGEVGRVGWPSRREIGHGALAERALEPVIPSEEKFPYTIRVVSEVLSSNGSTSMASTCGSSLSLMDAGVPISSPVAGIAMGLITNEKVKSKNEKLENEDNYVILSDIAGLEDFNGDMDFKIAGTKRGITAIQLDVKISGLTQKMLADALSQAKQGREYILGEMEKVLAVPRPKISKFAPKVAVLRLEPDKIGEVIGPGGRMIRKIIEETGCSIDVEDDGKVNISGIEEEGVAKAIAWIEGLTREVNVGDVFTGKVLRIQPFGAFVEILPGKEGLVHISQMAPGFVSRPEDVVSVGQEVKVRVTEIDERDRINLSMLFGQDALQKRLNQPSRPPIRPTGFRRPMARSSFSRPRPQPRWRV